MPHPQFGRDVASHEGTFVGGGALWYLGGLLAASGVVGGAQSFGTLLGLKAGTPEQARLGLAIAAATLLASVPLLCVAAARWKQRVEVYERGFVWRRLWRAPREVPFAQVARDERSIVIEQLGTREALTLTLVDGSQLVLSDMKQLDQLASMVRYRR